MAQSVVNKNYAVSFTFCQEQHETKKKHTAPAKVLNSSDKIKTVFLMQKFVLVRQIHGKRASAVTPLAS